MNENDYLINCRVLMSEMPRIVARRVITNVRTTDEGLTTGTLGLSRVRVETCDPPQSGGLWTMVATG